MWFVSSVIGFRRVKNGIVTALTQAREGRRSRRVHRMARRKKGITSDPFEL